MKARTLLRAFFHCSVSVNGTTCCVPESIVRASKAWAKNSTFYPYSMGKVEMFFAEQSGGAERH